LGQHSAIGVSNNAWLERVTSPWNEFTVTWNNQPSATTVNRVAVPASTSPSEDYLNMDVTTLTQDIISSPSGNFGIMLILDVEQTFRRLNFCTSDYPDSTKHPKLEISYVAPSAIDEITQANSFLIYQNPVNNFLTIKFLKAINETITYQVLDAIGESVSQEFTIPGNSKLEQMNISTLKSGLYFLKIKTNGLFFTRRFVKK
jgi:hypothetical protein